jgi:hypothetical protein
MNLPTSVGNLVPGEQEEHGMVLTAICFAVAVLSLPLVLRMKRIRDQREMEQFSITAEELLLT